MPPLRSLQPEIRIESLSSFSCSPLSSGFTASRQVGIFAILVAFAILASVSALYLNQLLQIRWRRWLTKRYLVAWLADRAYYKLQFESAADNPDQRIAEDLNQFTGYILTLSLGLISSVVFLLSFLTILWGWKLE
jgi:vitamin B12/bleomycin/antimicrobial peptide transport system ATP-binding/permease protein